MIGQQLKWLVMVGAVSLLAIPGSTVNKAWGEGAAAHADGAHDPGAEHGESGGHGEAPNPLSIDPDLALFTLLVFLLMVAILGKFAWRPIIDALDERERGVADQIAAAQRSNEDAQRLLSEHEKRLSGAAQEVRELLDKARADADAQKTKIVEEARAAAQAEKNRALREIDAARNEVLRDLADRSVGTAVQLAGQIVGRQLNADDHAQLIQDALQQFPSKN